MVKLIVSAADGYENGSIDALKSRSFHVVGSVPVCSPITSVFGSVGSGADVAASKNRPGTASLMPVNVTVGGGSAVCARAPAADSRRATPRVSVLADVAIIKRLSRHAHLALTGRTASAAVRFGSVRTERVRASATPTIACASSWVDGTDGRWVDSYNTPREITPLEIGGRHTVRKTRTMTAEFATRAVVHELPTSTP